MLRSLMVKSGAAILQIKRKEYAGALSDYRGDILLVGINYTKKTGKYTCHIEKLIYAK
ncbi:MAG: hypothetical protein IJT96_04590 [Lachnospiraceae bacterium]|nr:hypothetical protein [Lachnospiraceae bacterium]